MNRWVQAVIGLLCLLLAASLVFVGPIPDAPYQSRPFYAEMMARMDSLERHWVSDVDADSLRIGWSQVSIVPPQPVPLAGYGVRNPMTQQGLLDSVYVRTVVFQDGERRAAWISADLLVVHPEISTRFFSLLPDTGWTRDEIFFSATHTHSSLGGWAPGFVGKQFAGDFDPEVIDFLVGQFLESLQEAESRVQPGKISYNELQVPELVRNRLVRDKGIIDPWLKVFWLHSGDTPGYVSVYSAHATSLSHRNTHLSGDYPQYYNDAVVSGTGASFSMFAAGAMGSMAPRTSSGVSEAAETEEFADQLAENIMLLEMLSPASVEVSAVRSLRLPLSLPPAMMKINNSHGLRPWLFGKLTGSYNQELAILIVGDVVVVGLPCDFSGELAVPLYEEARDHGLHLVVTSFNGGYTGYVVKDDWYDENLYESRVMSWHGPEMGAYYTEVISRVLEIVHSAPK